MKKVLMSTMILGALALASCRQENDAGTGSGETSADTSQATPVDSTDGTDDGSQAAQPVGEVHSGSGDITEIEGDRVTISHGPVESIDWPAMTMTFQAESSRMLQSLNVGDPVDFKFRQTGEDFVLTSITRAEP